MTTPNTPSSPRVFAVIAGGGTAGHVIPALALAEHLGERGRSTRSIAFVAPAQRCLVPVTPARPCALRFAVCHATVTTRQVSEREWPANLVSTLHGSSSWRWAARWARTS
ncbi:MAG: hypothetical protein EBV41_06880 [Actinobacteria bacterium]|nr:hypothetical protein [Actinomycetota bacterium]